MHPKDHAIANKLTMINPQTKETLYTHLDFEDSHEKSKVREISTMLTKGGEPSKAVDSKIVAYDRPAKKKSKKSSSSSSSNDSDSSSNSTSNDPGASGSGGNTGNTEHTDKVVHKNKEAAAVLSKQQQQATDAISKTAALKVFNVIKNNGTVLDFI